MQTEIKKRYYPNGKLKAETPFVNGEIQGAEKWIHGTEKRYYPSGKLKAEIPYVDGKKQGIEKWYYPSGKLANEIPYVDGERQVNWRSELQ